MKDIKFNEMPDDIIDYIFELKEKAEKDEKNNIIYKNNFNRTIKELNKFNRTLKSDFIEDKREDIYSSINNIYNNLDDYYIRELIDEEENCYLNDIDYKNEYSAYYLRWIKRTIFRYYKRQKTIQELNRMELIETLDLIFD